METSMTASTTSPHQSPAKTPRNFLLLCHLGSLQKNGFSAAFSHIEELLKIPSGFNRELDKEPGFYPSHDAIKKYGLKMILH
ncbi:hypothetical protein N7495_003245 [Penicillium taxi]|uniref:uncharacterized protein n=1 Tax=Penicillium taxi TaxID=168475 RepID=UPI002545334C|nr:uncharacterized protein N7495_003245 [Penicillium taxi]KAJ5902717.1 hypothetical protein N7495_003245 [Penicillium taxi]